MLLQFPSIHLEQRVFQPIFRIAEKKIYCLVNHPLQQDNTFIRSKSLTRASSSLVETAVVVKSQTPVKTLLVPPEQTAPFWPPSFLSWTLIFTEIISPDWPLALLTAFQDYHKRAHAASPSAFFYLLGFLNKYRHKTVKYPLSLSSYYVDYVVHTWMPNVLTFLFNWLLVDIVLSFKILMKLVHLAPFHHFLSLL